MSTRIQTGLRHESIASVSWMVNASPIVGTLIWLVVLAILRPALTDRVWAEAILMFAALVLFPLAMRLVAIDHTLADLRLRRVIDRLQLPSALLLGAALLQDPGLLAAVLALPWLLTLGLTAALGLRRFSRRPSWLSPEACVDLSLVYLVVGGAWAVLDRAGMRPLDFQPVIVLLTAIHFHYAGFLLPLLTGLAVARFGRGMQRLVACGVLAGVPLVAIGITTTQLGFSPLGESLAACWLAAATCLAAGLHLRLAWDFRWPRSARALWGSAGAALLASMGLAAAYGLRAYLPLAWLDIPTMRAWHGTANSLGFALPAVLGWLIATFSSRSLHSADAAP